MPLFHVRESVNLRKGVAAALSADSAPFEEALADTIATDIAAGAADADRRMAQKAKQAAKEAKG